MTDDTAQLDPAVRPERLVAAPPPVFVDSSGRRQRRVRRIGRLLAVPAAGYLVLLGSNLLGGPTIHAPFLPQPPAQSTDTAPGAAPGGPSQAAEPAGASASAAAATAGRTAATVGHQPGPTAPAPATTEPAPATTAPTPAPSASATHGRPTVNPTNTHKPTKSP